MENLLFLGVPIHKHIRVLQPSCESVKSSLSLRVHRNGISVVDIIHAGLPLQGSQDQFPTHKIDALLPWSFDEPLN